MEQLFDNFLGNALWRWLVAGAVAFGIFFLLLLRRLAHKQYARLEATPQEELLELPLHVASVVIHPLLHAGVELVRFT